ncbi:MAG TPA: glucose 1-dehydrogenase [Smithellaceae bacterium]|jgi:NAD(P)-dependent dehydrogenase (short-subunit alcohol dehydrogenase family)|nr:glucose 1-dehydrogenase [Smithellaceae bacterium]
MAIEIALSGKVALVTGAGRGIGKAIALALAKAGADVCVTARTESQINQTAEEIRQMGRRALAVPADATNAAAVASVVEKTVAELGGLQILVNNAGMEMPKTLMETSEEEYNTVMDTNVKSMFLFTKAACTHLIAQKYGKIVNVASVGAYIAAPGQAVYHASKAAVAHLTKATAMEMVRYNINVNAVAPGWIRTELIKHLLENEAMLNKYLKGIPMRRLGEPEDVAPLVAFLCSDMASYITGTVMFVEGGITIP